MRAPREKLIWLRTDAPQRPAWGAQCNGCGVCCAASLCPAARILFWRQRAPCPALFWQESQQCYRCALVARPGSVLRLPAGLHGFVAWLARRWIAAGQGCDSDAPLMHP